MWIVLQWPDEHDFVWVFKRLVLSHYCSASSKRSNGLFVCERIALFLLETELFASDSYINLMMCA